LEAHLLNADNEKVEFLGSLGRLFTLVQDEVDMVQVCDAIKSEVSRICGCDALFYLRYREGELILDIAACSDSKPIDRNIIDVDESTAKWIESLKPDSFVKFDSMDSAPSFIREVADNHGVACAGIYTSALAESIRGLLLICTYDKKINEEAVNNAAISALLRAGILIFENCQALIDVEKFKSDMTTFFEFAPVAIFICDQNGKVISANRKAETTFASGKGDDKLISRNLLNDENCKRSGIAALLQRALQGEEAEGDNIGWKISDGKTGHLHVRFRPIRDPEDRLRALGVITDESSRIRLQQQLERSYQTLTEAFHELQRVDKMKTQFIDVVSHELRTPLTVIRGYLEMLDSIHRKELDEKVFQKIDFIKENTEKLIDIVESMLDITRLERGMIEIVKQETLIKSILDDVIASLRPLAEEKSQELLLITVGDAPPMKIDAKKIHDALKKIIHNAIKYTPEGGKIQVGLADEGNMIHIWIKDNGIGIPLSELSRIFDRFYIVIAKELSHEVDRMGLGLPIAKGIIESHGGKIWVESEVGKGTIFHINLPKV